LPTDEDRATAERPRKAAWARTQRQTGLLKETAESLREWQRRRRARLKANSEARRWRGFSWGDCTAVKLDRHDLEGRSEVARADEPGLTKYLNATELGADPRAIRSRPILRVRPSAMKGTLLEA